MLADDQAYPSSDPMQPPVVDAVHGLVEQHIGSMVLDLPGENAATFVLWCEPPAQHRSRPADDRIVVLPPHPVTQPVERPAQRL